MAETWFNKIKIIPYPPYRIRAEKSVREASIRLTWEADPKIVPATQVRNYRIYRMSAGSTPLSPIALLAGTASSFLDKNISIDRDYFYLMSTINANGIEGPLSEAVAPIRGEPFPPLNLHRELEINKTFLYREYINRVTWQANPDNVDAFDVTKYRVYRKNRGQTDAAFSLLTEVPSDQLTWLDRGLAGEQEADDSVYGVSAVDGEGRESPLGIEADHE
jgi:fibronectin type 3 domain-containing protein